MKDILSSDKINVSSLDKEFVEMYKRHLKVYVDNLMDNNKGSTVIAKKTINNGYDMVEVTVEDVWYMFVNNSNEELNEIILYTLMYDVQNEPNESKLFQKAAKYFNMEILQLIIELVYPENIMKKIVNA